MSTTQSPQYLTNDLDVEVYAGRREFFTDRLPAGTPILATRADGNDATGYECTWLTLEDGEEVRVDQLRDRDLIPQAEWQQWQREEDLLARARALLGAWPADWYERPLTTLALNLAEAGIATAVESVAVAVREAA